MELKNESIVEGMGIDYEKNQYNITFQIYNTQSSGGGGEEAKKSSGSGKVKILQSTGTSLFEAVRNATLQNGRKLYFSNIRAFIIGDEVSKNHFAELLDFMERNQQIKPTERIFAAKGKASDILSFKQDDEIVPDLKLACLRGILRYINSKKIGDIEATIYNDIPVSPYSVSAFTYNKQEKMLIWSLEKMNQDKGYISRPIGTVEIEFYLKNQEDILRQKYILPNHFSEYTLSYAEEITNKYPDKILQEDTDTIRNGEIRFFLLAHEKNWGFHVVPVARNEEQLYLGKKTFFAFENELSELDFFDGLK
jgi:hypothetical protein